MKKTLSLLLLIFICLLHISSCTKTVNSFVGEVFMSDDQRADTRMEQIISAIKDKDKETLKSLFSEKAIEESDDFNIGIDSFFNFIQGDVETWEREGVVPSDGSISGGKISLMLRFNINLKTDKEDYSIFIIDYNVDTKNPDNEGIYMIQIIKSGYEGNMDSWQERMRAGFYIPEK